MRSGKELCEDLEKVLEAIGEGVVITGRPKWFGHVSHGHKRAMSYMVCRKMPYVRIALLGM